MSEIIRLEKVNKSFGGVVVASDIDVTISSGEIMGLIGPNGAGKTSLFNLISGIVPLDSGSIFFENRDVTGWPIYKRPRLGISRTWQNIRLFPTMTTIDNLLIGSRVYEGESLSRVLFKAKSVDQASSKSWEKAMGLLDRVGLADDWDKQVSDLPHGQQKLIALARALMNDGRCLLLDEPMAGVEDSVYETMREIIREEAQAGRAVCVIEHTISFIKDLCNTAIFMFSGEIIAKGTVDELLARQDLADIYFG